MRADTLLSLSSEQLLTLAHLAYNYACKHVHIDTYHKTVYALTADYSRLTSSLLLDGKMESPHQHKCKCFEFGLQDFYERLRSNLRRRLKAIPTNQRSILLDDILAGKYSYLDVHALAPRHTVAPQYRAGGKA